MKNTTKKPVKHQQSNNYPSKHTSWAYWMQAIEPTSEEINEAFPGYHPQWVRLSQLRQVTGQNFKGMRDILQITPEQCAAYLRVSPGTVRRWEKGHASVPFTAFELLRMVTKSVHARVSHKNWDGWFISENGNLISPDVGGNGFTPVQLNILSFQRSEAVTLRIEIEAMQAQLNEAQAENTRLRQMYVAQGVVEELATMQETITDLMARIATAKIIPFSTNSNQLKEKTA